MFTKYPGLKHAYEHQIFVGALITKIVDFLIVGLVLFFIVIDQEPDCSSVIVTVSESPGTTASGTTVGAAGSISTQVS